MKQPKHDLGIFAGKTYKEVEESTHYEKDRTQRWKWRPPCGETYEEIAKRVGSFFQQFESNSQDCLIITHAVTMRIIQGFLENTLPKYPESIPKNGEIWEINYTGIGNTHEIITHYFGGLNYKNSKP